MLNFFLRIYRLDSLAALESDVEVEITLDGARLTSNLFHVTAGMKVVDCRSKHPIEGNFLLTHGNLQSRDNCFAFELHLMKDIKEGYNFFKNFFNFFRAVQLNSVAEDKYGKAIKRKFAVSVNFLGTQSLPFHSSLS